MVGERLVLNPDRKDAINGLCQGPNADEFHGLRGEDVKVQSWHRLSL